MLCSDVKKDNSTEKAIKFSFYTLVVLTPVLIQQVKIMVFSSTWIWRVGAAAQLDE